MHPDTLELKLRFKKNPNSDEAVQNIMVDLNRKYHEYGGSGLILAEEPRDGIRGITVYQAKDSSFTDYIIHMISRDRIDDPEILTELRKYTESQQFKDSLKSIDNWI